MVPHCLFTLFYCWWKYNNACLLMWMQTNVSDENTLPNILWKEHAIFVHNNVLTHCTHTPKSNMYYGPKITAKMKRKMYYILVMLLLSSHSPITYQHECTMGLIVCTWATYTNIPDTMGKTSWYEIWRVIVIVKDTVKPIKLLLFQVPPTIAMTWPVSDCNLLHHICIITTVSDYGG